MTRSGRFIRIVAVVGAVLISGCGTSRPQVFSRATASTFFKEADRDGYSSLLQLGRDMQTWHPPLSAVELSTVSQAVATFATTAKSLDVIAKGYPPARADLRTVADDYRRLATDWSPAKTWTSSTNYASFTVSAVHDINATASDSIEAAKALGITPSRQPSIATGTATVTTLAAPTQSARQTSTATTPASSSSGASACDPATSTIACPVAQVNLRSPTSSSTIGVAEVLKKGNTTAIAIVAQGVPANTAHNAYAMWLYNSASDAVRLGFVNPGVGRDGRLRTAGGLPADAARFRELLVTLETHANPSAPGPIVLEGPFAES